MAINLLPSEQKLKFKKQKSILVSHSIEMTGPKKVEKGQSSIKSGGVLGFFKQAFRKPKVDEKKKEEKTISSSLRTPERKIHFKEKISYKIARPVPKVEYQIPTRKPESLEKKEANLIGSKISNIFDKTKIHSEKNLKPKIDIIPITKKEQFPKYHSVSTEQLFDKQKIKTKKVKIIEVVSENGGDGTNKKHTKSIWTKIQDLLSGLFGKKKPDKVVPDPAKISGLSGFPKPKDGKLEVTFEKHVNKPEEQKELALNNKSINAKIGQPKKVLPKHGSLSYNAPYDNKVNPLIVDDVINELVPKKEIKSHITYVAPKVPTPQKPIDKVVTKVEKLKEPEKPKKEKVKKNYFGWLSKFWESILSLFSSTKENEKSIDHNLMTQVKENTEVLYKENKSAFDKIDFSKSVGKSEDKIKIDKPPALPPTIDDDLLPPKNDAVPEKDIQKEEEKIKMTSVAENTEVPIPLPPTPLGDGDKQEKEVIKEVIQTKAMPEGIVDSMDWEVNLIPEDEQEKNIPISNILYIIMSVIVSGALVFGGWLWANYYYNTISTTIGEIDAEISFKEADIAKFSQLREDARIVQSKITSVQELLDKHIYWSEFFNKLEFYTISDVYYNSMSVDVNGVVTLSAVGDSYENAVKQLMVMERANDFVIEATISDITFINNVSVSLEDQEDESQIVEDNLNVTFNINLMVQPEIFYYPKISL